MERPSLKGHAQNVVYAYNILFYIIDSASITRLKSYLHVQVLKRLYFFGCVDCSSDGIEGCELIHFLRVLVFD